MGYVFHFSYFDVLNFTTADFMFFLQDLPRVWGKFNPNN